MTSERHIFFLIIQVQIPPRNILYVYVVFQNLQSDFISGSCNQIHFFTDMINYTKNLV